MMRWLQRLLSHDRVPKEQTHELIHALRNQAQVAELQRHVLQRRRENEDLPRRGVSPFERDIFPDRNEGGFP